MNRIEGFEEERSLKHASLVDQAANSANASNLISNNMKTGLWSE